MTINNVSSNVPQQALDLFYSYIPFGSDYVVYTVYNNSSGSQYCLLFRPVGSSDLSQVTITHQNGGDYSVSQTDLSTEYDGFSVSSPYYAYSNITGQGRYTVLPSGQNLVVLMCVVCASLMILKTVFGGIRWFARRKYSAY